MSLTYDPNGRLLTTTSGGVTTRYLYDGDKMMAEYDGSTLLRRYAHGAGTDQPVVWYDGAGLNDRRWLHTDHQDNVVASSDSVGVGTVDAAQEARAAVADHAAAAGSAGTNAANAGSAILNVACVAAGSQENCQVTSKQWLSIVRPFAGYCLLFVVGYLKGGMVVALAVSMSCVAAHLNVFYLLHSIIDRVKGEMPSALEVGAGAGGIAVSSALVACGFWMPLVLATAIYLVVDALVLRFR